MIQAKLCVLQQEIELLWVNMDYHMDLRRNGRPASEVMGGLIKACYATDANTDRMLRWMTKESEDAATNKEIDKMEEGKVCFYENGFNYPPTKTYTFNDAHLIYFKEILNVNGSDPMQTIITISPAVQNYGAQFFKYWCLNRISPSEVMPYQSSVSETNKKFTNAYLTNTNNEKISTYLVGDIIILCLETESRIGDKTTINLNDPEYDFKYNGVVLENDTIENYVIGSDLEQIELEVVEQKEN